MQLPAFDRKSILFSDKPHYVIHLEMRDEGMKNNVSVMLNRDNDTNLCFKALLDRLVQSNMSLMTNCILEMTVQAICGIRRDGKKH